MDFAQLSFEKQLHLLFNSILVVSRDVGRPHQGFVVFMLIFLKRYDRSIELLRVHFVLIQVNSALVGVREELECLGLLKAVVLADVDQPMGPD